MKRILVALLLVSQICLYADTSYWDDELVRSYVHYSDLQRRWAWSFLAPHLKELQADAKILDIGCGDGKITADIAKFAPQGSVLGIDLSKSMLSWAHQQYHRLEYPNLAFQEGNFLETGVSGQFDWIVSFCAFQHCSDQKGALREIAKILKPNGKLLILVPAMNSSAWNQARSKVQSSPKWAHYWQGFPPRKFGNIQHYEDLLTATGLQVLKIENVLTTDPFIDLEEILDWLEGTFAPVVPKNEAREFYTEWIQEYLRLDPTAIDAQGTIYARLGFIGIEATLNSQ
jgi:trans-aconitate 2-methyltransferase